MSAEPQTGGASAMPYSVEGYENRARECAKLANRAGDELIQMELLKLRQTYLNIAQRLRQQEVGVDVRRH